MGGKIDGPGSMPGMPAPGPETEQPMGGMIDPATLPNNSPISKPSHLPGMAPVGAPVK